MSRLYIVEFLRNRLKINLDLYIYISWNLNLLRSNMRRKEFIDVSLKKRPGNITKGAI